MKLLFPKFPDCVVNSMFSAPRNTSCQRRPSPVIRNTFLVFVSAACNTKAVQDTSRTMNVAPVYSGNRRRDMPSGYQHLDSDGNLTNLHGRDHGPMIGWVGLHDNVGELLIFS